eukprot:7764561-Pyramimonas_sp.AAC.1
MKRPAAAGPAVLKRPPAPLGPLQPGDTAMLKGLVNQPDFNGKLVEVVKRAVDEGKWMIIFWESHDRVKVREDKLEKVHAAHHMKTLTTVVASPMFGDITFKVTPESGRPPAARIYDNDKRPLVTLTMQPTL